MNDSPRGLPEEYVKAVDEIDGLLRKAQKRMAGVAGEAKLDGVPKVFATTLERKSKAIGFAREDVLGLPKRVAEELAGGAQQ